MARVYSNFLLVLGERALELVAQLVRHDDVRGGLALVHGVELRLHDMVVLLEGVRRALRALGILRDDRERGLAELERGEPGLALDHLHAEVAQLEHVPHVARAGDDAKAREVLRARCARGA